MTDTLFSTIELDSGARNRAGYRLHRVEVFNWGTFGKSVWSINPMGNTSLLTGDIGSGKSTFVDAISTLLLPAHRIVYNKAAGADARERTLRSYVEGHYRSERNETTGASRPVALRDQHSYSVILGVFRNEGMAETVTIAQVFHQKDRSGQPDRFFVTAQKELSIDPDFSDFGPELKTLRARLRTVGAEIDSTFPDYQRRVRRLLGIRSEQAMELFHQTVSMKSVGNLNDFVRDHMLEPTPAEDRVRAIVDHFENLTRIHRAMKTAADQLEMLEPLAASAEKYRSAIARQAELHDERAAIVPYVSTKALTLVEGEIGEAEQQHQRESQRREDLDGRRIQLARERERLVLERAGMGGDRLQALDREIPRAENDNDNRAERRRRYEDELARAGLDPVRSGADFQDRGSQVALLSDSLDAERRALQEQQVPLHQSLALARQTRDELAGQIESLARRRNNLPEPVDRVRRDVCAALSLDHDDLPFAGELLDVLAGQEQWRGAAERVLRGLALSMLVPQRHYAQVSRWVNANRLNGYLVYLRVPEKQVRTQPIGHSETRLSDIVEVEPGEFEDYLASQLARRADHVLADSVADLMQQDRAVTREGMIRDRDRHEKDDRRKASDPKDWVLGRSNEQKIQALQVERARAEAELTEVRSQLDALDAQDRDLNIRGAALSALRQYAQWSEVDSESSAAALAELIREREDLVRASSELADIDARLERLGESADGVESEIAAVDQTLGGITLRLQGLADLRTRETAELGALGPGIVEAAEAYFPALDKRARTFSVRTSADCERLREVLRSSLDASSDSLHREILGHTTAVQNQMGEFLRQWPDFRSDMDARVEAIGDFLVLRERIVRDDLPRFEAEFRRQLGDEALSEMAQFNAWLRRQAEEIGSRVETINDALSAIDYSPGRIIRLIAEPTVNQEVKQFQFDLRAVTGDILTDQGYNAEQRFEQIRALIDRFKGRADHSESDRQWTRRVTDVRTWFTFAASERGRETDTEFEHYTDSDGKSGGQKEKLAYTILAASLAYQFGLEWGVETSRDFRFVVIDEAFGRGSDASTTYALELFAKLGLQLLVVTPLQKVHVIEPYVSSICFVDNPTGAASHIYTLTIEEFRERQRSHR